MCEHEDIWEAGAWEAIRADFERDQLNAARELVHPSPTHIDPAVVAGGSEQ